MVEPCAANHAQLLAGMAWWHRYYAKEQSPEDRGRYESAEEEAKFESLVRYGSTRDTEVKPATYNPFADLKAKMEAKK